LYRRCRKAFQNADGNTEFSSQYQTIKNLNYELSRQNEILQQKEGLDQIPILSDINDKLGDQKDNLHALNEERRKELDSLSKITDKTEEQFYCIRICGKLKMKLKDIEKGLFSDGG